MITLREAPRLIDPTVDVEVSYLTGEQADMRARGSDDSWLGEASEDFRRFVDERVGVRERWGVPSRIHWFVSGPHYLGTLVLRHELIADEVGGHIGYHVVHPWQNQGHATRMLALGLALAADAGIGTALLTVAPDNEWSRRVVLRNGGMPDGRNVEGEDRFLIPTSTTAVTGPTERIGE